MSILGALRICTIVSFHASKYSIIKPRFSNQSDHDFRTPKNLRPTEFYRNVPCWSFQNVNSSVFIWKYLNRTIYRSPEFEGADRAFLWHLRNKRDNLNAEEQALKDEFGLKAVYPEELFYQTHKISQKDFLAKLRDARDKKGGEEGERKVKKYIGRLYKDESVCGRRGVRPLKDAIGLVK